MTRKLHLGLRLMLNGHEREKEREVTEVVVQEYGVRLDVQCNERMNVE